MSWLYFVDDVGRVLAPVLLLAFVLRFAFTTKWWVWWDTRALLLFMTASVLTKILLAVATALAPPRVVEVSLLVQLLNIGFWWIWVGVAVFLLSSYEVEQRRARVAARSKGPRLP